MTTYEAKNIPIEYLIYKITIMKKSVFIMGVVCIGSILISKEFSFGFLVGGLLSIANFSLLAKHILKMRELPVKNAKRYIITKFLLIYFIAAVALFIAATKGMGVFAGTAVGLITTKFAIFIDNMIGKNAKRS